MEWLSSAPVVDSSPLSMEVWGEVGVWFQGGEACQVSDGLVLTVGGGLEGAGGLASGCCVAGDMPSHGEFLHFCRE